MWSIGEVKSTGMFYAKRNYWSCVLAALLIGVAGGSASGSVSSFSNSFAKSVGDSDVFGAVILPILLFAIVLSLTATAAAVCAKVFALNLLMAGGMEYMHRNLFDEKPSLINLFNGFRVKYWAKVRTLFFVDLYVFLWTLLFIVPGIIKSYAYRLVPYIIAENPDISTDDALRLSDAMMQGNKGRAFGYDLSFIGWAILSVITFGAVGVFYFGPYKASSDAVLYERIKQQYNAAHYSQTENA